MEESVAASTVGDSGGSHHSDVDNATSIGDRPRSDQNLRMFTRYDGSPSGRPNTSEVQSDHQNGVVRPTRPFNSTHPCNKPNVAQPSLRKNKRRQKAIWKTMGTIFGFYLTALFAALGHFILFKHLNGRQVHTSFLTQTQVSAVSILLSTIFKAALTASMGMGMCFAQHLWYLLRGTAMSLSTVEMLFVIRTNIIALLNPHGIRRAPLLFLMALLIWCVGLATVYPPGALIVVFKAQEFTEPRNLSVMNPPLPLHLDLAGVEDFPTLGGHTLTSGSEASPMGAQQNPELRWFSYDEPDPALMFIAQAIVFNNQMFTLPGHPGENSSYHLEFRGPQFTCTTEQYNSDVAIDYKQRLYLEVPMFTTTWDQEQLIYSSKRYDISNYTVQGDPSNEIVGEANCRVEEQICIAQSVLYDVAITFPRGVQTVEYSFSGAKVLPRKIEALGAESALKLELPPNSQAYKDWYHELSTMIPSSNEWAILDALGALIEGTSFQATAPSQLVSWLDYPPPQSLLEQGCDSGSDCHLREGTSDSTTVCVCKTWLENHDRSMENSLLKGTIFHTDRFVLGSDFSRYDPRRSLNITEAMLNEVLANITISAISLGTWWDMVPVTSTRYRSTYNLSDPLNLMLPYSICLAAATVFMAIAMWSLWCNRAPAVDGGFLQIMMATVGDTALSRVVLEERVAAIDDMTDELRSLKIRYGGLVNENTVEAEGERLGFGTVNETISLRTKR